MRLPAFEVRTRPLLGTRYIAHRIVLADGRGVHEQLSPYGVGEVEARVREFLAPKPAAPPPRFIHYARRGPKPKGRKGEAWRDHSWLQGQEDDA